MKNLKTKIIIGLISFVAFILVSTLGNQSFAAITSMNELMAFAETSDYFTKSASSFIGVKFTTYGFDWTKYKTGYCINHDQTGKSGIYIIKHVIDIDLDKTAEKVEDGQHTVWYGTKVSVHSGSSGKTTEKIFNSGDNDAKAALMWSYLAYDAYHNGEVSAGNAKHNFYYMLKNQWNTVSKLGINSCFVPGGVIIAEKNSPSYEEAEKYANTTKKVWIKDKTKADDVSIECNSSGDYTYIGPYEITYGDSTPEVDNITLKVNGTEKTAEGISTSVGGTVKDVSKIKSGEKFYIVVKGEATKVNSVKLTTKKYTFYRARIILVDAGGGSQSGIIFRGEKDERGITIDLPSATLKYGNLTIKKIDSKTKKPLANVGFIIRNVSTGDYVTNEGSDTTVATYNNNISNAKTFKTGPNGEEVVVKGLLIGQYEIYETINPNYGYVVDSSKPIVTCEVKGGSVTSNIIEIPNRQTYVKLSGYVWVDKVEGKTSERNNLYKTSSELLPDTKDVLFNGITVRLKDKTTGETVKETITSKLDRYKDSANDGNGEYLFTDVLIEKLNDYYIEFEYDGLTYTNVVPKTDINSGSKAAEIAIGEKSRDEFNKGFSVVEGKTRDTGITRDDKENEKYSLSYNINETGHEATLINNGQYTITANTDVPNFSIQAQYVGQEEIKYINLGLYEREQPDIALVKDLQNVKLTINGYEHTYVYARRFLNAGEYGDGFNVGVKFGSKYGSMSYSRSVYKADYEYENEKDRDKELKVYVTYKITMRNQSTNLIAQVNSIVDYYDSKYQIVKVGSSLGEREEIVGDIAHVEATYNDDYTKTTIENKTRIGQQKEESIYVQFMLNREAVINILNDKENLDNVAEINSYSIYDGEKIYAGIDIDSNPGNCIPGDTKTYEDDTDSSPALKLEVAAERKMAGKVFLDSTSGDLQKNEIRQGSGIYEEGEEGIEDVEVTLRENTGSGMVYTKNTDANGDFLIEGYIPGDYTLTYTWGDKTYTVQNYKGTVYNAERNQNDKNWYKQEVDTRYTDAIDNYDTEQSAPRGSRIQIDEEMNTVGIEKVTRTKMDATTPTMGIGIEEQTDGNSKYGITSIESEMDGDKFVPKGFYIENIDFGIVERARQVLDISKDVTGIKITLANNQTIIDAKVVDGKLEGDNTKGLTYMGPSNGNNGTVKAEIDNELIQGATIQIEYAIKVTNKSEVDYDSENYYKYGTKEGNIIQMKPEGVYDYLDSQMVIDTSKDSGNWEVVSRSEYDTTYVEPTMIETYFSEGKTTETRPDGTEVTVYKWEASEDSYQNLFTEWATKITEGRTVREAKLDNKTILRNADLERELKPGESNSVKIYSSKVLSNTDEIDLNNDTEMTDIRRVQQTGRIPDVKTSHTYDKSETVTVTPPTGENQNYIIPIIIGVTALIILGAGVVIIKKKAI